MTAAQPTQRPCRICGEPTGGQHTSIPGEIDPICRDCDLDELVESMRCEECRQWCVRPNNGLVDIPHDGHAENCSKVTQ